MKRHRFVWAQDNEQGGDRFDANDLIYGRDEDDLGAVARGESPEDRPAILPMEMRQWISDYADQLRGLPASILREQRETLEQKPVGVARAEFAEWAKKQKPPKLWFKLLDGKAMDDDVSG